MDLNDHDNRNNLKLESSVPLICKTEEVIMGIDEAGRGPVLGPMVYGASYCPSSKTDILKSTGFADSKTLTEEQREGLFEKLNEEESLGWFVNALSPNYISNCMLRRNKYNLNSLSHDTAISLIHTALQSGVKLSEVYLDTVGDANSYETKLNKLFPTLKIVVSKKADSIYPVVSAASICAKVFRDRLLKRWSFREGALFNALEWGSGYPGDPKTKAFLSNYVDAIFGFPQLVRFSWSTASNVINKRSLPVTWEDDDDDDDDSWNKKKKVKSDVKMLPLSNFFGAPSHSNSEVASISHKCLTQCNLTRVDGF